MKSLFTIITLSQMIVGNVFADEIIIKKSKTSICHAPGTTYYKQTKYYKAYKTLRECLESGGRLPKK